MLFGFSRIEFTNPLFVLRSSGVSGVSRVAGACIICIGKEFAYYALFFYYASFMYYFLVVLSDSSVSFLHIGESVVMGEGNDRDRGLSFHFRHS